MAFLGQISLCMHKISHNSNSGITFDVVNELCNPDFLEGVIISSKLYSLASTSADFHILDHFGELKPSQFPNPLDNNNNNWFNVRLLDACMGQTVSP
jgi:hypothetical protein